LLQRLSQSSAPHDSQSSGEPVCHALRALRA
jgi:hypothetical protein